MATHTEWRRRYRGVMVVSVVVEVEGVTLGAGLASLDYGARWWNF